MITREEYIKLWLSQILDIQTTGKKAYILYRTIEAGEIFVLGEVESIVPIPHGRGVIVNFVVGAVIKSNDCTKVNILNPRNWFLWNVSSRTIGTECYQNIAIVDDTDPIICTVYNKIPTI